MGGRIEPGCGFRGRLPLSRADSLLEFRQPIDDTKSQVIPELDLHHLGGELLRIRRTPSASELQFSSTPIYEMINKQGRQVVGFFVAGVVAQVEDL